MQHKLTAIAILLGGMLMLAACTKEESDVLPEGVIRLTTEHFASDGGKMSVQDNTVIWEDGDVLTMGRMYDPAVVHVSDGVAWISSNDLQTSTYSNLLYPSNLYDFIYIRDEVDVNIPAAYSSRMVGTRQRLALPMGAHYDRNDSTNSLCFRHISAAVKVMLWNSLGSDVVIDTVRVTTRTYRINGSVRINFTADNLGIGASDAATADTLRTVTVAFPFSGDGALVIPDGDQTKSVQVPILPIGADKITIKVYGHKKNSTEVVELYSHTASSPALARNQMLTAKVRLVHIVDLATLSANVNYTAQNGDMLTGNADPKRTNVMIADGATVYLNNANIQIHDAGEGSADYRYAALTCEGNATIVLMGTNTLKGGRYCPGLHAGGTGTTLTIKGDGTLTVTGGESGAGIGGRNTIEAGHNTDCGNIVIESGTIIAQGGNYSAGIGGAERKNCGNITITGGNVRAIGGNWAAGIGSSSGGTNNASWCGNINITGGTVYAQGGQYSAGIGCGVSGCCGNITIGSGVTRVEAVKGGNANHSIGKSVPAGAGYPNSTCGSITIGGTGYGDNSGISESPFVYQPSKATQPKGYKH